MQTQVLTIEEVADYLRLPEEVVLQEAVQGHLPGRKIADTWRFLKDAIDDWLRTQDSRAILLSQAGSLAEDERFDDLLKNIYRERERAEK
jgi:excisionase family DNA binding protein